MPDRQPGVQLPLYFEDITDGLVLTTQCRTVTETDLVQFAMFSGDWNPLHVDAVRAAAGGFGRRVVHGVAAFAIMGGLMYAAGWFSTTMRALLGFEDLRFLAPVFIGDTVHCRMTIESHRRTSSGQGLVVRRLELVNQDDTVVQRSTSSVLIELDRSNGSAQ